MGLACGAAISQSEAVVPRACPAASEVPEMMKLRLVVMGSQHQAIHMIEPRNPGSTLILLSCRFLGNAGDRVSVLAYVPGR